MFKNVMATDAAMNVTAMPTLKFIFMGRETIEYFDLLKYLLN